MYSIVDNFLIINLSVVKMFLVLNWWKFIEIGLLFSLLVIYVRRTQK